MNIDEFVDNIKKDVKFKPTVQEKDIVMVLRELPATADGEGHLTIFLAVVKSIEPNIKRDWYTIKFVMLSLPLQYMTLILRLPQLYGEEMFTINGDKLYVAAIDIDAEPELKAEQEEKKEKPRLSIVK